MLKSCFIIRCNESNLGSIIWIMVPMKLDDKTYLVDKTSNFELVSSNFFGKLIRGPFGMLPNIANVWFPYKCAMDL